MNPPKHSLLLAAAITGLLTGCASTPDCKMPAGAKGCPAGAKSGHDSCCGGKSGCSSKSTCRAQGNCSAKDGGKS